MRIQTDGTITLEARECRVLTEAAAIVAHIGMHDGGVESASQAETTLQAMVDTYGKKKPAPEPPEKSKGPKKGGDPTT